jgi:phage gpG-like protein
MAKHSTLTFSKALKSLLGVPSQIAGPVAKDINQEIQKKFDAGQDPYGKSWASLKPATLAKGRHPPPLTDTGKGRSGVKAQPMQGAGIALTSSVSYMGIHQKGNPPILARRSFFPVNTLPKQWLKLWEKRLVKGVKVRLSNG